MLIFKCKMCGGDIHAEEGATHGTCDSCGTASTLPKANEERIVNLFNRANHFRRQNEFDKAMDTYGMILNEDSTNAEAHWGIVLCRYGIEYVEDQQTHERIPTCHRTQYASILTDADYLATLENAPDSYAKGLYEEEAKVINDIQKDILSIANNEKPYDVFICYKETTDGGSRTKDSTLAQDIYYHLTNENFKVFFSRITLEDRLGTEYEPYIFNALNSAKVMLVVGTKPEHFNAVWIKNEWSRFLSIMKADRSRILIPCYRDMEPYDLPDELAMLQSQDMGKIGFTQDITRGIKKILETTMTKTTKETIGDTSTTSLKRLIQNSNTYLKLNNYYDAQEVFNRVTKEYPEDYRGWWGLIICETKGLSVIANDILLLNTWFRYVKQLAPLNAFTPLESEYVTYTKIIAESDVANEISTINRAINSLNANIKEFIKQRKKVEHQKSQRKEVYENQTKQHDNAVSTANDRLCNSRKQAKKYRTLRKCCGACIGIGVFLIIIGGASSGWFIFGGIVSIAIGFRLINTNTNEVDRWESAAEDANKELSRTIEARTQVKNQFEADNRELDSQIEAINTYISQAEKRIAECEQYIVHGKSKMIEMFFAQRCKAIGVNQHFDNNTERLRKVALGQELYNLT